MPRKDGTGPLGSGGLTGRGLGLCTGINTGRFGSGLKAVYGRGLGLGLGNGCRRGRRFEAQSSEVNEKELLSTQKELLQARLNTINKQLDDILDK